MDRRALVKKIAISSAFAIPTILLPKTVLAGKGWCRMDPYAVIDGQNVEFWGSVFTEVSCITNAEFRIYKPSSVEFEILGDPDCPVTFYQTATTKMIRFVHSNSCWDNLMSFEMIPIDEGPIEYFYGEQNGSHYDYFF